MQTCHICHQSWLGPHAPDCRVHADVERLRRVHERMVAEGRNEPLTARIAGYLGLFGDLPCQQRPGMPTAHDCDTCGHKEVCVILPEAA